MQAQKRYANRYIACFVLFCILFSALTAFFIWCGATLLCGRGTSAEDAAAPSRPIIVIDAGHGGEDGGASGTDGTKEKDLNLLVAQSLADILTATGYDVRMTRADDRLLYDLYGDLTDYKGHKKTYDLRNRLRFTEEAGADLLISIHMNKFPQPQYSGLQVYYSPTAPESRTVAEVIRSYTRADMVRYWERHYVPQNMVLAIAGNWLGSGLAIKNGAKLVRPVMIFAMALLLIKVGSDLFLA